MADAGRIVIIPKGEYKSNITYERLDAVEYNNNGYIALKTVTGITPTNDGTNWTLYVKGTQVDSELSTASSNPVANKVVAEAVNDIEKEIGILSQTATHNMPRIVPKDITSYITDGTFYQRLNGTDGFDLFEDIYVGDYIKMSRPITCPNQDSSTATTGSQYVTIIGLDALQGNGDNIVVNYHHAVMTAGKGFGGVQHFGRHRMNSTNTTVGGYVGSEMNTSILGAVTSSGSTAGDATINQQLYAEFGSHLKTTRELCSNGVNESGYNRFGSNTGCSNSWAWGNFQAILMSEIEVYGSTVWSSSGYDTGNAKMQMPLFTHNRQAMNNRGNWYWLKDMATGAYVSNCDNTGRADYSGASNVRGSVRPRFVIGA